MHESELYKDNCYITLTYAESGPSLVYRDFQLFMKRLRKRVAPAKPRFFMCGEYGELNRRPHFHALLFGIDFADKVYFSTSPSGFRLYRSATLEGLWTEGFSSVGAVTFASAAYVARYIMTKELGDVGPKEFVDVLSGEVVSSENEFCRMSLKPGIGYNWLQKYSSDVYPTGLVVVRGTLASSPKYYDKWYKKVAPEKYAALAARRVADADVRFDDNSASRLLVKERVLRARIANLKRGKV